MRTFVKLGGLTTVEELALVPDGGAAGLVVGVADSPRNLAFEVAAKLAQAVPSGAEVWAVTRDPSAEFVHRVFDELGVDRLEVHGAVPAELEYLETHHIVPTIPLPRPGAGGGAPKLPAPERHPILRFDAPGDTLSLGSPDRPDWEICRGLVEAQPGRKFVLSGGLEATNAGEAIASVRPWGLDVSAGVAGGTGKVDPEKVRAFLAAVASAEGNPA